MDELSEANMSLTLDFEMLEIRPGFGGSIESDEQICGSSSFMTRALGGSVPGPTLRVSPGTSMKIKFRNNLTYQKDSHSSRIVLDDINTNITKALNATEAMKRFLFTKELDLSRLNKFNDPDVANLHFHGLHVPGILPGDDTTLEVLPQQEYDYIIDIPEDHEPGLHWIHPHHHGSSALHLSGGAALALIVKDSKDDLPVDIRDAPERVMVFQEWEISETIEFAEDANDFFIQESYSVLPISRGKLVTVNGQHQPTTEIEVGKWERWRFLYAGWEDLPLQFGFTSDGNSAECEFYMLAKDGIYLSDYPRGPMLSNGPLPIPPGGRADFMVRCNKAGATTRFEALGRRDVLTVNCVENEDANSITAEFQRSANALTPWRKTSGELPDYLQSLINTPASNGCSCETKFDNRAVNGRRYKPGNNFMHTSYLGAVVERSLKGMQEHSYHQHVYPFQLIDFPEQGNNEYFKIGDWHDTYQGEERTYGPVTIRYKTTDIPGKMIVHCHNSEHADEGMVQKEYVRDISEGGTCECNIFGPIDGPGISDDFIPRIVGAVDFPEWADLSQYSSSARPSVMIGLIQYVPALLVVGSFIGLGMV